MSVVTTTSLLTSLATLKDELGITDSSKDVSLRRTIAQSSAKIETYVDRTLGRTIWTDTVTLPVGGDLFDRLFLDVYPLVSIQSVDWSNSAGGSGTLETSQYWVVSLSGTLYFSTSGVADFAAAISGSEFLTIAVNYTGGYILPDDTDRNLPPDIESAVIDVCKFLYFGQARNPLIRSETVPDVLQTSYFGGDQAEGQLNALYATVDAHRDLRLG